MSGSGFVWLLRDSSSRYIFTPHEVIKATPGRRIIHYPLGACPLFFFSNNLVVGILLSSRRENIYVRSFPKAISIF